MLVVQVVGARDRGDRIIVLTHVPMLPAASSHRTVLYDSDEVLKVISVTQCTV